jgi:hypothetical protein
MSHRYDKNKDPSQKYYNILVKNNNTGYDKDGVATTKTGAVELSFEQTRTIPYIHYPRDFFMSVVAFEMDTQSVPVFIADPIVGQNNVNKLVYTITMEYSPTAGNHTVIQTSVIWFPEDASATIPTGNVPDAYNMDPYYYSYTYQHLINVVNKSLQACWTAIGTPVSGSNDTSIFLTLENNMVSLHANKGLCMTNSSGDPVAADNTALTKYVKVYFNSELFNLFSSLEAIKQPQPLAFTPVLTPTSLLNTNYQLLFPRNTSCKNNKTVSTVFSTVPPSSNHLMIVNYSEYSPLPYWNPIDKIVFTTAQLPVVPQLIAAASNYYDNTQNASTNAEVQYILCDFSAALKTGTEYKPNISYIAPAEYVLNELYSDKELYSISIFVFWKDKFGDLHPFYLEPGGTALLKIMFRKKEFYLN